MVSPAALNESSPWKHCFSGILETLFPPFIHIGIFLCTKSCACQLNFNFAIVSVKVKFKSSCVLSVMKIVCNLNWWIKLFIFILIPVTLIWVLIHAMCISVYFWGLGDSCFGIVLLHLYLSVTIVIHSPAYKFRFIKTFSIM